MRIRWIIILKNKIKNRTVIHLLFSLILPDEGVAIGNLPGGGGGGREYDDELKNSLDS